MDTPLPEKPSKLLDQPESHDDASEPVGGGTRPTELKGVKVLLVDDEHRFRQLLAHRLELRGCTVLQTGDGEESIRIVRAQHPQVVVLDRKMPGMQGEEVLLELKRIAPRSR
jgi:CheY-like chemotaxis protein